jgi:hypothetical protein
MEPKKPYIGPENVIDLNRIMVAGGDDIATATVIAGLPYSDIGATTGFADDYDQACFSSSSSPDVVYAYTPTSNESINISLCNAGTNYDTKLFIYENSVATPYDCSDDDCPGYTSEILCLALSGGNTYYIVIDGWGGDFGDYELTVDVCPTVSCQGNDDFATAIGIPGLPYTDLGTTESCTDDYVESCALTGAGGLDVVYSYVPTVDQSINVSLCGSSFDTKLYVYENTVATPVGCDDDGCPGLQSQILCLPVTAGNTYYIVVDGYSSAKGDYTLSVDACAGGGGGCDKDVIATAEVIPSIPALVTGTTAGCSDDYDEACPFSGSTSPDVVYSYTPTTDEIVKLSLCNSSYDTKVYIYENAETPGSPFACDDDDCGFPGYQSALDCMNLVAGNTYYIIIDGYGGNSGDYELSLEHCNCQGNNSLATATVIPSLPFAENGSTADCTDEFYEVCPYTSTTPSPDVVYEYTPAGDESVTISLCGSSFDTKLYVYENAHTPGAPYGCNDDDCSLQSQISCLLMSAGNTYYIVVDGYGGAKGDYALVIDKDVTPPVISCPGDMTVGSFAALPACDGNDATVTDDCDVTVTCDRSGEGGVGCSETQIEFVYTYTATDVGWLTASCSRTVTVLAPDCPWTAMTIANPDLPIDVVAGSQVTVPVSLTASAEYPIGEFNLLVNYDPTVMSLIGVARGGAIGDWGFFTYRLNTDETGQARLIGVADAGQVTLPDAAYAVDGPIAYLTFTISADQNLIGTEINIASGNAACGDNMIVGKGGVIAAVGAGVDIDVCRLAHPDKLVFPTLTFAAAPIRIIAPLSGRGDVNRNGIAYEVGDAVLISNVLVYGESVLDANREVRSAQLAASDINDDGIVMSVGDLVQLSRILTGEASPTGEFKLSPYAESGTVTERVTNGALTLTTSSDAELGGALFVLRYSDIEIGTPTLTDNAAGLTVTTNARNGELRILVSTDVNAAGTGRLSSGTHTLVTIPTNGNGSIELAESQLSDANGVLLSVTSAHAPVPSGYSLAQNYPNPFNAGTVIPFELGQGGAWTVQVVNVSGQTIRTFTGNDQSGRVEVAWDGTDRTGRSVASGVYFYRVVAGEFAATRKMTLLK